MTKIAMINYMIENGNIDKNRKSAYMRKLKDSVERIYNWCKAANTKYGSPKNRM